MKAVLGANQLCRYANPVVGKLHASFEHVGNRERLRDLPDRLALPLERETRGPCCDLQVRYLREHVEQRLRESVGEVIVTSIASHVHEGQYGDRRGAELRFGQDRLIDGRAGAEDRDYQNEYRRSHDCNVFKYSALAPRGLTSCDFRLSLDSVRRKFVHPRQDRRGDESQREHQDHHARRPLRRSKFRKDRRENLGQQPADYEVGKHYLQYVPPLEFFEDCHWR